VSAEVRVARPAGGLRGACEVPGDKSLAHRAVMLGALADGITTVTGFPGGADVLSTLDAVQRLGARAHRDGGRVVIEGRGLELGQAGPVTLDCGNSGTTMRLMSGLVAGHGGTVTLIGDTSLSRRPMERVAAPLRQMGAEVATTDGHAPVTVRGGAIAGREFALEVASAQVKSAILLAGLRARGTTSVREPLPSRDHTERMLGHFGVPVIRTAGGVGVTGGRRLRAADVPLPGDVSSAAFLAVAALLVPGSDVVVCNIGANPTRTGALDILRRMGADLTLENARDLAGEPRADLRVRTSRLTATRILPAEVPAAIDELPILAVAAAFADGETTLAGAAELRVKESDRLAALEQLGALGVEIRTTPDGFAIRGRGGRRLDGGRIVSGGDHRVAMAFAVAGLASDAGVTIDDRECVAVSFPGFFEQLAAVGGRVEA